MISIPQHYLKEATCSGMNSGLYWAVARPIPILPVFLRPHPTWALGRYGASVQAEVRSREEAECHELGFR